MAAPVFEATSKPVKLVQLIGILTVLGSAAAGALYRHDVQPQQAAVGAGIGVAIWVLGKSLAWWRHG